MKKIILTILITLFSISEAKAEPMQVDLGQMFSDYKENEYAFKQKYTGKDLQFTALVSSIRAGCYTNFNGDETPCIELEHKKVKVSYFYIIPTNIGKALMYDNNDLVGLQKKQEINLICRLREDKALFESDPLVFENCKMVGKEYPVDEKIKAEIVNNNVNELDIIETGNCGTNCSYELDNKGLLLIKPTDNSTRADIQKKAFKDRKDFTKVKIKEGITSIGDSAFDDTYVIKIDLPETLTSIGESAFHKSKLKNVDLPNGLISLGKYAFSDSKLKKITIPDSLTEIEDGVFSSSELEKINLPNSIKSIGAYAFLFCKMESIKLPTSLEIIGEGAFARSDVKTLEIPNSIKEIKSGAFHGCNQLQSVVLPNSLEAIREETFFESGLKKIVLPDSLKSIEKKAFKQSKILEINIPDSVVYIDDEAFACDTYYGKHRFSYLVISDTTEVSEEAFKNATIGTVYCRGDVDTCKENLEDAVPETTEFASLEELRVRQEAEARAKAEAEALAKEQETNSKTVDKNIFINKDLMKTITPEQLKEYIAMGGDVNASDSKGTTVLMVAALSSSNPQILEILIDNGSAIESKRENGWTALAIAARYNTNPKIIQTLLDKGAIIQNSKQLLSLLDKNTNIEKNQDYWDLRDRIYNEINR